MIRVCGCSVPRGTCVYMFAISSPVGYRTYELTVLGPQLTAWQEKKVVCNHLLGM